MKRQLVIAVAAVIASIAAGGCGSASTTTTSAANPVLRAAAATIHTPGYRMSATVRVTSPAASVNGTLSGVLDTLRHTGAFTMRESVAGHTVLLTERIAGTTVYMKVPNQPALTRLTGGKPWLKMDLNRALGTLGFGALPTQSSNPAQFLDYLRAVSAKTTRVGSETIRGRQTTHYHAVTNLDDYPKLFPPSSRAAAARGIANLERITRAHTMPMDVWIDSNHLVRRMSVGFSECIRDQQLHTAMTMDISAYGPQTVPPAPNASQVYDITPFIVNEMKNVKLACTATS